MAEESGLKGDQSSNFFDTNNKDASREREHMASECLENLISWLKAGGNVGIHGASSYPTSTTDTELIRFIILSRRD